MAFSVHRHMQYAEELDIQNDKARRGQVPKTRLKARGHDSGVFLLDAEQVIGLKSERKLPFKTDPNP